MTSVQLTRTAMSKYIKRIIDQRTLSIGEIAALASVANDNFSTQYAVDMSTLDALGLIHVVSRVEGGVRTQGWKLTERGQSTMSLLTGIPVC